MGSPYQIGNASTAIPLVPGGVSIAGPIEQPNTLQLPPHLFPPANAIAFNLSANQAIVGASTNYSPAELELDIPDNCYGVISAIDLNLDAIVLASRVFWRLLINGSPLPGWNALTILGRSGAASVSRSWDGPLGILVPLGGTIGVQITDVDGGAYTAGTQLYGWFWPQQR